MITRICARLILVVGIAGLTQVQAGAQSVINAAASEFGTQPAPYATPGVPVTAGALRAQPVAQPGMPPGGYQPGAYAPGAYVMPMDQGASAPDPNHPLGRGDSVSFAIVQDQEAPQLMRVTDTGELDFSAFPKIGRISVVGRTCAQVAGELKHKLEADYYNHADVVLGINTVNTRAVGTIYVTGLVRAPGPQEMIANQKTMLSSAIIRAGDFSQYADDRRVKVTRVGKDGKSTSFIVDVKHIIKDGHREKDVELEDGDYVNVPQKWINY